MVVKKRRKKINECIGGLYFQDQYLVLLTGKAYGLWGICKKYIYICYELTLKFKKYSWPDDVYCFGSSICYL